MVEEEIEDGLSLAVPIYNRDNKMIGAMNIGSLFKVIKIQKHKRKSFPLLLEAANENI